MRQATIRHLGGFLSAAALFAVAADTGAAPSLRRQITQRGDFALIGNTMAQDCRAAAPAPVVGTVGTCPPGTSGTSGNGPDVFWEADFPAAGQATASTAITLANARSTAVLDLPSGATVTAAYLYWGARPGLGNGADLGAVVERPGVGGFSSPVTATASWSGAGPNLPSPAGNAYPGYQSIADVTAIVQQNGAGAYRVGGVDSLDLTQFISSNTAVGWWMVVFYHDAAAPFRQVTLWDGFDLMGPTNPLNLNLTGFSVPSAGFTAHLGAVAWGGDLSATGETLSFNGNILSDALNPADNWLNGTRSALGAAVSNAGDLPQLTGAAGSMSEMDIDVFDVTAYVSGGQTTAAVDILNTGDFAWLGGLVTSITTLAPDFSTSTKTVADLTSGTTSAHPGDVLEYTITVVNSGTDIATNTVLTDPIPTGTTYVPGSLRIVSGPNAGLKTDGAGDDQGEFDGAAGLVRVRLGSGATAAAGGLQLVGSTSVVSFQVQIKAGMVGIIANQATITAAGQAGAASASFLSDGNGAAAGSPPTTIPLASCPIASCACLLDSDCGGPLSGTVCNNGANGTFTCIPGCRGAGGNGCTAGSACSSTTVAIGTCSAQGACNTDSECTGGKWCNEAAHLCADRLGNSAALPTDPPHTNPTLDGVCTAAAAALVCQSGACDTKDNLCGLTLGSGPCDASTGATVCRNGACDAAAGVCGCVTNADCSSAAPNCDANHACVGCTKDADCGGTTSGLVCDATTEACVAGCRGTGNGCPDGETCTSTDATPGTCAPPTGCTTDTDCGDLTSGKVCDPGSQTCIPGCRPDVGGNGCPSPLVCTSVDAGIGQCVACLQDETCGGPTSGRVCDPATNTCIAGCRAYNGNQCLIGLACTSSGESIGECVICVSDYDCGDYQSGLLCDTATHACVPGCRGSGYGNQCPAGGTCSSESATPGTCDTPQPDQITASGSGLVCAARPGSEGDRRAPWMLGALVGAALALRRRRRTP
jgi:uncharacterized repeat protein (TIGR01451 family)/MYXO-CTERM domain-containing protein